MLIKISIFFHWLYIIPDNSSVIRSKPISKEFIFFEWKYYLYEKALRYNNSTNYIGTVLILYNCESILRQVLFLLINFKIKLYAKKIQIIK